ncbi:hypothetical protein ABEB36_000750 [Hypothenemus hampei]|uniref:Queuine tRNA-ribosyltransferase accessory subunit 2 n=1 Tax=Hypothenemus hampei TaxID=57062 RepID=A0ABD1FCA3_HYPHA
MKFTVNPASQRCPRLGRLEAFIDKPEYSLETPLVLLHTQGGQIPHVTHEVLKLITEDPQILQIPLVSMHCYHEAIRLYNGRVSEFVGNKDCLTCITVHDPSNITKQGHHMKDKVPIFTRNGKVLYDSKMYMSMIEQFKPDMYILLSDGDTNISSPNKRIAKAVESTVSLTEQCIEIHKESEVLKETFVIAPVAGGYCLKSRQKCIDLMQKNNSYIQGYLIDGLHNNGSEVEFISFAEVKPVVDLVVQNLSPNKLVAVQGCWSPLNIIKLVKSGVDLYDTSYCRILTERSAAIIFAMEPQEHSEAYEINLRQPKYAEDFQPLLRGCNCVACQGYSRGYIHHLLTVQELLGSVLIMIHNIYYMLRFFRKIRDCIKNGNLDDLEDKVATQFKLLQLDTDKDMQVVNGSVDT